MKARARKFGSQQERSDRSRAKLVAAAIELIAERGPQAIAVTEVERRAGLNRGLGAYHFGVGAGLFSAAMEHLAAVEHPVSELGLPPLMTWARERLAEAAAGCPQLVAAVRLATASGLAEPLAAFQRRYWETTTSFVERHLMRAKILGQVLPELDAHEAAELLVAQLHGELLRIVTTRSQASVSFIERLQHGVAAPLTSTKTPRRPVVAAPSNRSLFDGD